MSEPEIEVSRDPRTGAIYFPRRALSVDGTLRPLDDELVPPQGTLVEVVAMGDEWYGYVDVAGEVRILTELGNGPHVPGTTYRLAKAFDGRRFDRA